VPVGVPTCQSVHWPAWLSATANLVLWSISFNIKQYALLILNAESPWLTAITVFTAVDWPKLTSQFVTVGPKPG